MLQSLAGVRLDRYFPVLAFLQALGVIVVVYRFLNTAQYLPENKPQTRDNNEYDARNGSSLPALSLPRIYNSARKLPRALTLTETKEFLELLGVLARLLTDADVEFIMCDGTHLGSYVSHGFLPWDDDADIIVNIKDIHKVKHLFRDMGIRDIYGVMSYHDKKDEYTIEALQQWEQQKQSHLVTNITMGKQYTSNLTSSNTSGEGPFHKFKFFKHNSRVIPTRSWKWPFVDVKFYEVNSSHVSNIDFHVEHWSLRRGYFYPLYMRPFGSLWMPAPYDTRAFLRNKYGKFSCIRGSWNHKQERHQEVYHVNCQRLHNLYLFVSRRTVNGFLEETLNIGSVKIHTVKLNGSTLNQTNGYYL